MIAASDPNQLIGGFAIGGLLVAGLWRLVAWVREAPIRPDPWDDDVTTSLTEPDAVEVCHRCFTGQPAGAWFCNHCGSAVGQYNNLMPFVQVFSEGEVFRNGVTDRMRNRPLVIFGYLLFSLSSFAFLAPIYWFYLFKNLRRPRREDPPAATEPPAGS